MKCPKCKKANLRRQVSVFVECDADCRNLSKSGIRNPDVKVLGAGWPQASLFCPKCSFYARMTPDGAST